MPLSYAETRNIVFLKTPVRGRSLFTEKKGTMKAIRIHNYGGPDVLKYEDAPRPEPQADEVLVQGDDHFLCPRRARVSSRRLAIRLLIL